MRRVWQREREVETKITLGDSMKQTNFPKHLSTPHHGVCRGLFSTVILGLQV